MDSSQNGLSSSTLISSPPRKHYNPIGSESQWSLGWQGTESQITRTTSSKSTHLFIKVSQATTTRAVSSLVTTRLTGRRNLFRKTTSERREEIQWRTGQFGTTIRKTLAKRL
jgi:hypothetical protein